MSEYSTAPWFKEQKLIWAKDSECKTCHCCGRPFTLSFRKHHCRGCGHIICDDCSRGPPDVELVRGCPERVGTCCWPRLASWFGETYDEPKVTIL